MSQRYKARSRRRGGRRARVPSQAGAPLHTPVSPPRAPQVAAQVGEGPGVRDYSYVPRELRRIGILSGAIIGLLLLLSLVLR